MIDQLPAAYVERMKILLGGEAEAFLASYAEQRTHGLRINKQKLDGRPSDLQALQERFGLTSVPWCEHGYYYEDNVRPGRHPFHAAGLYYIQEPSAMSAVELLAPEPWDTVLDLAGAPGGKSTQIAARLGGKGLLIANEIHPARAKILSENIERMGIANAVVTNMAPRPLADRFPAFFDKIMLDAPCSGEGMFRKDPEAVAEWSVDHVAMCAARQMDIMREAVRMLKPGGLLGYSTCTFAPEENEQTIEAVLQEMPDMELLRQERIWPHLVRGEGHFVAVLRRRGGSGADPAGSSAGRSRRMPSDSDSMKAATDAWRSFEAAARSFAPGLGLPDGEPLLFGEQLYWLPHDRESRFGAGRLHGLKVVRPGLHAAEMKKDRFEPSHALALSLPCQAEGGFRLSAGSPEALAYLRGETLNGHPDLSGWCVVRIDGYPLGWGKASGGQVKNHYPKGLRWNR